jgi:LysM repeat protein/predicted  nucleic acid-binding Zn-ribbon protein
LTSGFTNDTKGVQDLALAFQNLSKSQQSATLAAIGKNNVDKQEILTTSARIASGELVTKQTIERTIATQGLTAAQKDELSAEIQRFAVQKGVSVLNKEQVAELVSELAARGLVTKGKEADTVATIMNTQAQTANNLTQWQSIKALAVMATKYLVFAAAVGLIVAVYKAVDAYTHRVERAAEATDKAFEAFESTKSEMESTADEIQKVSDRLDELYKLQGTSEWNTGLQDELTSLETQNATLRTQIELLKEKKELEQREALDTLNSEVDTTRSAKDYSSLYNYTMAPGAYVGQGMGYVEGGPVYDRISEAQYYDESIRKLAELRAQKQAGIALDEEQISLYDGISSNLNEIGIRYSEWAQRYRDAGNDDKAREYELMAAAIAKATVQSDYYAQSTATNSKIVQDAIRNQRGGIGEYVNDMKKMSAEDFMGDTASAAYKSVSMFAEQYGMTIAGVVAELERLGYFQKSATDSLNQTTHSFSNLSSVLSSLTSDTDDLQKAMDALSSNRIKFNELFSGEDGQKYLESLLSTFPQLRNEILAYNDSISAGGDKVAAATKLQQEMNDALNQFRADKLVQEIENISSAAESYGKDSHAVIEAIEELDGIIPGLSNTLIDENGVLRDNAVAALTSAEGLLACVEANKSLGLAAAQLDLSNAKKQLDDLGTSASMAAIRTAEAAVMTAQLNLDKTKESIEAMLGNVGKPKSSSGKKEKDALLESYQAEIARLDHLREMDQINEATYYNDKLAALQTYLKDRKKYQEQWWAWEEEFHKYQKRLIEDEIDRLEDARDDQIDANEEYYKARKKQEEDAYEAEKDRVDKVIDELDRELDAKKKSIQKQRDLLDEQADDREYNKSIEQKNKEIADIKAQLTVLDLDDSAEAKAKKIALQEELTDKLNDLEDYQYDHSVDTQKNALDKQETYWEDHFGKLIEAQELYLENLKTMYDQTIESIESSMEAMTNSIKASFDSLIAAQQSLLNNAGSIPGMAEITPIGGGSGDDKPGSNEYKVKKGDNLSRIAKEKGTSVSKLLELNPWIKDKNKIYPGQIIKYHDGGVVGKSINDKDKEVLSQLVPVSRDEVLAKLLRGEVVVNEKQQGLMRDAWMSIAPSMALATKQADMTKALASNVTTNNSPNIVFDMKIELGNTDAAGLTALQRQLENFKNEAVKAVYERMSNHRQKTGRINPSGRY